MATTTHNNADLSNDSTQNPLNQWLARAYTVNWLTLVWITIFVLAIFTRFYILGNRVMSHDESLHTRFSYNLFSDGDFKHTPLMHGPILFHMTALNYFLFGANDFTSRIYTSVLGIFIVMSPLLFRRWLGRWGTILASVMLLISPLMMYYNRYIREDTPAITYSILMGYAILMYLNGPTHLQRRARWLYLLAAATILNLGSKETAFIYIGIFGGILVFYWFARIVQDIWDSPTKQPFYTFVIGAMLGGIGALGMYVILDIIPTMVVPGRGTLFSDLSVNEQRSFILWTMLVVGGVITVAISTLFWAFRDKLESVKWRNVVAMLTVALLFGLIFLIVEELSHTQPTSNQPAVPVVPGEETEVVDTSGATSIRWGPMLLTWGGAIAIGVALFVSNQNGDLRRFKLWLDHFPEFDLIIILFTLVLPWITAIVPYLMKPTTADYIAVSQSLPNFLNNMVLTRPAISTPEQVGQVILSLLAWIPLMTVAIVLGLVWNWKKWLIASGVFHLIFAFFFTTVFTNIDGLATGMIYSLGYWLEQQGVRRGSQPQYYYLLIVLPFYEFLPILGSVLAMFTGTALFWNKRRKSQRIREEIAGTYAEVLGKPKDKDNNESGRYLTIDDVQPILPEVTVEDVTLDDASVLALHYRAEISEQIDKLVVQERQLTWLTHLSFLLFVSWWAVLNLVGFTLAGEKMPWLGTHMTMPMILLAAWFFGRIFEKVEFSRLLNRGWMYVIILPLLLVSLAQVILPFFTTARPFVGLEQSQLARTSNWLAVVVVSGVLVYVAYRLVEFTGWRHLRHMFAVTAFAILALITFRSAWMASFINYDYANEFLVYAHGAPGIKWVLNDIEELSLRVTGGKDLKFAYDNLVPWPYSWYFRDYKNAVFVGGNPTMQQLQDAAVVVVGDGNRAKVEPLLEDRYYRVDHMRLWWPMQEYFYLTADRVNNVLDFSGENTNAAMLRQGIMDIWWNRDYTLYGQATNKDFSLTNWPVADRMHVYIRKDYAAQIWPYGVGEGTVENPLDNVEVNVCNTNWIQKDALSVFEASPIPMTRPLGISVGSANRLYVAEENGHRISMFSLDGTYLTSIGQPGGIENVGAFFTRPNAVAVGANGDLFVADTWNYRIQQLTSNGDIVKRWGQPGEYGLEAPALPPDGFWGPRDVAVDSVGRVYVADTGNKRIRVYDVSGAEATLVMDIGSGGSAPGQIDEPSSMVISTDGRVFIADYWNRRISIFRTDGAFLTAFNVRAWYDEQGNRPYLALDESRNLVYVTDPDAGRVIVYDMEGNCVGAFGQLASEVPNNSQFRVVGGIDVDADGYVYVSDPAIGRVLKFTPFDERIVPPQAAGNQILLEVTEDVQSNAEATTEMIPPDITAETTASE